MVTITSPEQAFDILAKYGLTPPPELVYKHSLIGMPIQEFMATQCYLEKGQLLPMWPHVNLILDIMFYSGKYNLPHFYTRLYSTIKKSIKTATSAAIARYVPECYPGQQEVIFLASDSEQAKGRGYKAFRETIERHPRYNKEKRIMYGPNGEELWSITDRHSIYIPDGSEIKPVSSDFAGEAGGNPTVTMFSELWTYRLEKENRLYQELTIPPTRPHGFRFIDSYAGFRGESSVLWNIWRRLKEDGYQLTIDDVPEWGRLYPNEDKLPIWVHIPSRTIGYIDTGVNARRFPWQKGEQGDIYYAQERASAITDSEYLRLHENVWAEPTTALLPIQWWDNCIDKTIEPLKQGAPVIVGADASVLHDCTAMSLVSRHPTYHQDTVLREEVVWDPQKLGGEMNYDITILPQLVEWSRRYNIVSVVYDKYQLKYLMDRVAMGTCGPISMSDGSIAQLRALPVRSFNQQSERRESDTMLVTMIRDRKHWHLGDCPNTREHLLAAAATHDTHENTKLHIVKRDTDSKIDLVISDSMANKECMELGI